MKKLLIIASILFSSAIAQATGKLFYQGSVMDEDGTQYGNMLGLVIYQPLFKGIAFNSFTGYGDQPLEVKEDVQWYTTKNQLDFQVGSFTLSPGLQYTYVLPFEQHRAAAFVKLAMQLW